MKKKLTVMILAFVLVLSVFAPMTVSAANGWEQKDGYWYYYYSTKDYYRNSFEWIGGEYYFFDVNGRMKTGWFNLGGNWYYAKESGALASDWQKLGGVWYYFDPGYGRQMLKDGIYDIDGTSYFFADSGAMQTGWIKSYYTYGGKTYTDWYYATSSGALVSGWQKINGVWYYFEPSGYYIYSDGWYEIGSSAYYFYPSGAMGTGWIKVVESHDDITYVTWFYANDSGKLQTGWKWINGAWYYFDDYSYYMHVGCDEIDGQFYVFQSSGALVSSAGWVKVVYDGGHYNWYYTDAAGHPAMGWRWINGAWYYFYPDAGYMVDGTTERIDGVLYAFADGGALFSTAGWHKVTWDNGTYGWVYTNKGGIASTGWLNDGGKKYYLHPDTGFMVTGGISIQGILNLFDSNGAYTGTYTTNGWKWVAPHWYYIRSGKTVTGWQTINSKRYYFDPNYAYMYDNGIYMIGGTAYYFNSDGALQTGWIKETKEYWVDWYYANSLGALATGWRTIEGVKYYFDPYYYYMYSDGSFYIESEDAYYEFDASGACKGKVFY